MCVCVCVHICLQWCMCMHNMCECISASVLHLNVCTGTSVWVCCVGGCGLTNCCFTHWFFMAAPEQLLRFMQECWWQGGNGTGLWCHCQSLCQVWMSKAFDTDKCVSVMGMGWELLMPCLVYSYSLHSTFIHMTLLHSFGHQTLIFCPILWLLSLELLSSLFYIMSIWNSFSASLLCHLKKSVLARIFHCCVCPCCECDQIVVFSVFRIGCKEQSIEYLKEFVETAESSGMDAELSQACHNLGNIFNSLVN